MIEFEEDEDSTEKPEVVTDPAAEDLKTEAATEEEPSEATDIPAPPAEE